MQELISTLRSKPATETLKQPIPFWRMTDDQLKEIKSIYGSSLPIDKLNPDDLSEVQIRFGLTRVTKSTLRKFDVSHSPLCDFIHLTTLVFRFSI